MLLHPLPSQKERYASLSNTVFNESVNTVNVASSIPFGARNPTQQFTSMSYPCSAAVAVSGKTLLRSSLNTPRHFTSPDST